MARINIGTCVSMSSAYSFQRKLWKTTTGKLILFAVPYDSIKYKTSIDNGDTWSDWTIVFTSANTLYPFDTFMDVDNNVYIAIWDWTGTAHQLRFIKLTYSEGSWTIGSNILVSETNVYYPSITKRNNGDLWISRPLSSTTQVVFNTSTDDGVTWGSNTNISYTTAKATALIPIGSNLWLFVQGNAKLRVYEYTTSWDSGTDIATSGITDAITSLGVLKVSDSEIYCAGRTSSGIKIYKYTGSWDGGTLLSDNASDESPFISYINNQPICIWADYDGSNWNIAYRRFNGLTWDSQVLLTNDSDKDKYPVLVPSDVNWLYVEYTTGTSYPLTIYFDRVSLNPSTQKTIISNAYIVASIFKDFSNKINLIKQSLIDVINDFRFVKRILKDVDNIFIMVKSIFYDVKNDFRTQKLVKTNINNDFRMIKSWQIPGAAGFQSLGKGYIHVFINGIEVNDVDVDSISINRSVGSPATANFDLARPYDASKPNLEATVKIKYNNWDLFNGYIISVMPSDTPEHITIDCNDKSWLDNRDNVYFYVGHKPADSTDVYRSTIYSGLQILGCNFDVGRFVPQTIGCFGVGKIDAINSLIEQSGNFGMYYDINNNMKLWTAGQGSIVSLESQKIGKNLGLYQVLNQQLTEDVSEITNKFRVQMGDRVIKEDNRRQGTSVGGSPASQEICQSYYYHARAKEDWDYAYQILAKDSKIGYGFDYHKPEDNWKYNKIFKKYTLPYIDKERSKWSDIQKPVVEIKDRGSNIWLPDMEIDVMEYWWENIYILKEGFTIDYEEGVLRFNEPIFLYTLNEFGECTSIRAPTIILHLWKEDYYTISPPSNDPEDPKFKEDISNPLMFFTNKMGDYPKTIIGNLDLSGLGIQVGRSYIELLPEPRVGYTIIRIPSWNDTEFAKDQANWQLSKVCDSKIRGFVDVSLDALCFYNIELGNRIFIKEIMNAPLNIESISLNLSDFRVKLQLENSRYFKRSISLQSRE